jgi:aspartyl-tRNA synthetase
MAFTLKRTHKNNELRSSDIGKEANLNGWVHSNRVMGGLIFIDLRDRYGITQLVFDEKESPELFKIAHTLKKEDVIAIRGIVRERAKGAVNKDRKTGEIEVNVKKIEIIGRTDVLPIDMDESAVVSDELRMKYRYLDLRKSFMQKNLKLRHDVKMAAHEYFTKHDFLEIETPILVRSTPEGARDYLVPSRVNKGKFYALPQSPQLYKQLLMIAGVDRYYQIAKCLRDEDLRADRQPEHTQLDLEMSFVTSKDIMHFINGLYHHMIKKTIGVEVNDFPVLSYDECMERFGCDKPDLRYGLEITDLSEILKHSEFGVFKSAITAGGKVRAIVAEKDFSRKEADELTALCKDKGAKGLVVLKAANGTIEGSAAKFLNDSEKTHVLKETSAKDGSTIFIIADSYAVSCTILNALRQELAKRLDLIKPNVFKFCWVNEFPLFEWDEGTNSWTPAHHMFSMPKPEHVELLETDPGKIKADLFDIVLNGTELGSGSIRIHDPEIQKRVMKVIGLDEKDAMAKFGFLLEAYKYGAPVHGGMGLGLDRFVTLLAGLIDIRDVIAFPKNKSAQCPMDGSPNDVDQVQLKELGLKIG